VIENSGVERLYQLSSKIVAGASLEESLEHIYLSFHDLIPYDRIGYADVDIENQTARARWSKANGRILLRNGYSASLIGSSLSLVIENRRPRVLDDLPAYLENRPNSHSTKVMVAEGIKSSMTCPLFVDDAPTGLLFFSSRQRDTYSKSHVTLMKAIASNLAMLLKLSERQLVKTPVSEEPTSAPLADSRISRLSILQLKPGMILEEPILLGNRSLLLAAGSELTQMSIERLTALNRNGFAEIDSVCVRSFVDGSGI
jgi:GAF domain-containing protein